MTLLILFYSWLLPGHILGAEPTTRWLVEINISSEPCIDEWWHEQGLSGSKYPRRNLSVDGWLVIEIPDRYFSSLKNLPCVIRVQKDMPIRWRDTEPNDPAYINQAHMELIGMPEAWDIARGGVTAQGDTIVVALLDTGFNPVHEDLKDNLWKNRDEIPDDGVDNDLNGYTDDFEGVNISTGNDNHLPGDNHGTEVAGIVGASGNNLVGVAGVNWKVKMMWISGADFESELIEAYEYILQMRKKYRLTNGAKGAFVVATNLSGGVDYEFAEDHPLWCEMYDKLGEEGILSVASAPNHSVSVDEEGDMATTCTSPFLITVTNVDLTDEILGNAGYGLVSIDMGAPGSGSITTTGVNQYGELGGTSAAAPYVSGTVALIYSTPCPSFLQEIDSDPDGVALKIKSIILSAGQDNNSLDGITVTGKRLQTDAALIETITECDTTEITGVKITSVRPNPSPSGYIDVYFTVVGDTSTALFDLHTTNGDFISSFPISSQEFSQGYIRLFARGPLPAGLYLLTLRNKEEKATVKIITGF